MSDPPPKYSVAFIADAHRDVKGLDGSIKRQLKKVLQKKLAIDPEAYGTPLHAPLTGYWKHEFGSHRVIYRIYRDRQLVVVCAVGPRKKGDRADVYQQLATLARAGRLAEQVTAVLDFLASAKKTGPRE